MKEKQYDISDFSAHLNGICGQLIMHRMLLPAAVAPLSFAVHQKLRP